MTVTHTNLEQGYILITSPVLSNGTHSISANVTDGAGNVSALAASYSVTMGPDSSQGQTFTANNTRDQVLTGTAGDDIFYTGHNSVILTGNGGADQFIYQHLPVEQYRPHPGFHVGNRRAGFALAFPGERLLGNEPDCRRLFADSCRTARAERRFSSIRTDRVAPIPGPCWSRRWTTSSRAESTTAIGCTRRVPGRHRAFLSRSPLTALERCGTRCKTSRLTALSLLNLPSGARTFLPMHGPAEWVRCENMRACGRRSSKRACTSRRKESFR